MLTRPAALLAMAAGVAGFTFSHTQPAECQQMTLRWEGGTPPFYATVIPSYPITGARIQNISIPTTATTSSPRTFSFPLNNPRGLEFSLVMSDATGFGTGGVTPVLQIDPSSNQGCYGTPPPFGFYFYWDPPMGVSSAQCQPLTLSWGNDVVYPLQALVVVPGAAAFSIPVPQTPSTRSVSWPVSVREGGQYQILMAHAGQVATGGSTNLTWVTAGTAGCLNANSPGPGVRVATLLSAGPSGTSIVTSARPSMTMSASTSQRSSSDNSGSTTSGESGPNVGAIAGGVVGGIAAIALLVLLLFCCRRRKRQHAEEQNGEKARVSYATDSPGAEPDMRQAAPLGAAAVFRRATRSHGQGHSRQLSRTSFDILGGPTGTAHTPPSDDPETPASSTDGSANPFVSPFPAPPPRSSFDRTGPNAVAWGQSRDQSRDSALDLRHARGASNASVEGLGLGALGTSAAAVPAARAPATQPTPIPPPALTPLNTTPAGTGRHSRKISGTFNETPPQTPVMRSSTLTSRSPIYQSPSSNALNRWSVDEDQDMGSAPGTMGSALSGTPGTPERAHNRSTTFIQHNDAGPGHDVVELPPSYHQLRARNPDPGME